MKRLKNMLRGILMKKTVLIYKARYGYMRGGINLGEAIEGRCRCYRVAKIASNTP